MDLLKPANIPNIVTVLRIILLIPIFLTLIYGIYDIAFILVIIAGISDGIDGYLARKFHWTSRFGAFTDPLADKLLMLVIYSSLTWLGFLPWWLFSLIVLRDIFIMVGVLIYRHLPSKPKMRVTLLSKINTVLQIVLAVTVLYRMSFEQIPEIIINALILIVATFTLASFIDYGIIFFNEYYRPRNLKS